ncbi:MAG: radical SAM protein [Acidobacteriota bacterium]
MVLRGRAGHNTWVLSLKPHSVAVSLNDTTVAAWDRGGRLYSMVRDGATWRRGLSGEVLEKRQDGPAHRRRRLLPEAADRVVDEAASFAVAVRADMVSPAWVWDSPLESVVLREADALLDLNGRFDAGAARRDAERFARLYRPVGILPPDQYLSLVLQATEGCSFNTCTFCDLYHDRYRVRSPEEFKAHVGSVLDYLGESVHLRSRGIFLGSANALAVPMSTLVPVFETLVEEVDAIRRGVFAFVDGFTGTRKTAGDYRLLGHLGLRRVYVGLESGHDPLLAFARKPGRAADAIDTVRCIKTAGVQVGVIVMTGLGGTRFAAAHLVDTVAALNAMDLGAGDLLYFSDLVEVPGTPYPALAAAADILPLDADARQTQQRAIRAGLRFQGPPPQMATYDVGEFIY